MHGKGQPGSPRPGPAPPLLPPADLGRGEEVMVFVASCAPQLVVVVV